MSEIHEKDSDLYTIQDLLNWNPPRVPPIIHGGVLGVGHRMIIAGDGGTWKSMLGMHMAYSVANGWDWLGFRTSPAIILLIQGEMEQLDVLDRTKQYCQGTEKILTRRFSTRSVPVPPEEIHRLAFPDNVINYVPDFLHLDEQAGINGLRRKLDEIIMAYPNLPILVIIDPMYKIFHHDLTVAREVNYFVENIDLIIHDYNREKNGVWRHVAFVIIHHTRKAGVDADGNRTSQGSEDTFGAKQLVDWWPNISIKTNLDPTDETKTSCDLTFPKHGRNAQQRLPKLIRVRWDGGYGGTLHPQILTRLYPSQPEDLVEYRGDELLDHLE